MTNKNKKSLLFSIVEYIKDVTHYDVSKFEEMEARKEDYDFWWFKAESDEIDYLIYIEMLNRKKYSKIIETEKKEKSLEFWNYIVKKEDEKQKRK